MFKKMIRNIIEVITGPSKGFARIAKENDLSLAFIVLCIISLLTNVLDGGVTLFYGMVMMIVFWIVEAGILHSLAKLFGAQGDCHRLLVVNAYTAIPSMFLVPLTGIGGWELAVLIVGGIWTMLLSCLAIRSVYSVGVGKAVIMMVLLYFILAILFVAAGMVLLGQQGSNLF